MSGDSSELGIALTEVDPGLRSTTVAVLEPNSTAKVSYIETKTEHINIRDPKAVALFVTSQQKDSSQIAVDDVRVAHDYVSIGNTRVPTNRVISVHHGVHNKTLYCVLLQHDTSDSSTPAITFHYLCRSNVTAADSASASKEDDGGASAPDSWKEWVHQVQVRASHRSLRSTKCANFACYSCVHCVAIQTLIHSGSFNEELDQRPSLILLNPASASGNAVQRFEATAHP